MDERPDVYPWWNQDEQALYARLGCTSQGLDSQEASRRQALAAPGHGWSPFFSPSPWPWD
ncbi:hypothetical protein D9M68_410930 [compost metagenome]|uniref:Uncharacterized protein n=1 Tax=Achromobacter agilis TaxID=1353888 RepID=A0A446CAY7_9BURK|nr:hypothetical protein [Achromobacter agilis]SSW65015.1 hypothetical protein AGI3411_01897 [Achromobacter agilis]